MVVYGGSAAKLAYIISNEQEKITHELLARDMGVTRLTAEGAIRTTTSPCCSAPSAAARSWRSSGW